MIYSFIKFKVFLSLHKNVHDTVYHKNALQLTHWPCNWSQISWVKQTDNTADVQWDITVHFIAEYIVLTSVI